MVAIGKIRSPSVFYIFGYYCSMIYYVVCTLPVKWLSFFETHRSCYFLQGNWIKRWSRGLTSIQICCWILLPWPWYNFAHNVVSSSISGSNYLPPSFIEIHSVFVRSEKMPTSYRQRETVKTWQPPLPISSIINRSLSVTLLFLWVSAKLFCFALSEALTRDQD